MGENGGREEKWVKLHLKVCVHNNVFKFVTSSQVNVIDGNLTEMTNLLTF